MTMAIAVTGLRKSFGDKLVLDGIDLNVAQGTVFSIAYNDDVHVPFTAECMHRFTETEPMQAAGAALLKPAWSNAEYLIR